MEVGESFAVVDDVVAEPESNPNLQALMDQNISAITHNLDVSDTSKLDTFIKESEKEESSISESASEEESLSEELDLEKSTEKIRQFVGMAEDIHKDDSFIVSNANEPNIGAIGSRPTPQPQSQQKERRTKQNTFNNFSGAGRISNAVWPNQQAYQSQGDSGQSRDNSFPQEQQQQHSRG